MLEPVESVDIGYGQMLNFYKLEDMLMEDQFNCFGNNDANLISVLSAYEFQQINEIHRQKINKN